MTRISSIGGGFSGYHTISRSLAAATGASEYFGSTMVFVQAAAPTGWTQVTTYNDYALRIVSGATGTGGSVNFSSVFTSITPTGTTATATLGAATDATTISSGTLPGHTHTYTSHSPGFGSGPTAAPSTNNTTFNNTYVSSDIVGSPATGQSHTHPAGTTVHTTFSGTPFSMAVKYIDCILATKT